MTRRHRVVSFHANELDGGIHARLDSYFDRRDRRRPHTWAEGVAASPMEDILPERMPDDPDDEPKEWLDEDGEVATSGPYGWRAMLARGFATRPFKRESGYADKHAGRKAVRKSWTRHPHRLPVHGMTEAEIAVEPPLDGYREGIERKLAERGVTGVTVEVIPRQRAA